MKLRASSVLVAAALAMAGAASPLMQNAVPAITQQVRKRQADRWLGSQMLYATKAKSRRTVAQDKRAALKARNRKRR